MPSPHAPELRSHADLRGRGRRDGTKASTAGLSSRPNSARRSSTTAAEERRAEDALQRRQAAYLAEAQKLSRTGSFGWNVSSGEIFWSDETFRIFGYATTMRPSIDIILQRVHPDDAAIAQDAIDRAADGEDDLDFECRLLMPDGAIKHLRVIAHVAPNEAKQFIGAISDITGQRAAYAALERSEQRYREAFNSMPIGLTQVDASRLVALLADLRAQGVTDLKAYIDERPEFIWQAADALIVEGANEHTVRMLGASSAADVMGPVTRYWRASPDTMRRNLEARYRGEDFFQEETKLTTVDGRVIDVLLTTARGGALADKTLVGFTEITDRVRAQEALSRVRADLAHAARVSMLGELTASIAHEVNQPLAAITASGQAGLRWLGRPTPDLAEVRELTERIVADARRAADVIARVRGMAARRAPEQTVSSLDEIIRDALLFLQHEVQSRGVSIAHHPAPAATRVSGDRTQLQQVIVNLAVNSMQAMASARSAERRIVIRTALIEGGAVRCSVEDSGPGIDSESLARLFESFFTTKEGGMGMGLPICRSIVEAHDGRIMADNDSAEGGARFSFTLPAAAN